jgi:hypothetical protein
LTCDEYGGVFFYFRAFVLNSGPAAKSREVLNGEVVKRDIRRLASAY